MTSIDTARLYLACYDVQDWSGMAWLRPLIADDAVFRREVEAWLQQHEAQAIHPGLN